jgi:putative aldouronate transport system substrate-binding protein
VPSYLKFTENDARILATLQTDLHNYVMENMIRFITTGVTDTTWNNFVREIDRFNVRQYLEIMQRAYDIYMQ